MERIPPDDSKLFCQQRLDAISKKLEDDMFVNGAKKMLKEMWHEELTFPYQQILSVEEVIERYGYVLTSEQLDYFKELLKKK